MKRKTKKLIDNIMTWIVIFAILGFVFYLGYALFSNPVTFAIGLNEKEIPKGSDGILIFSVKNYNFIDVKEITVQSYVIRDGSIFHKEQFDILPLNDLGMFNSESGSYTFNTKSLMRGDYRVFSQLNYTTQDHVEPIGKYLLSLEFKII